MPTSFPAMNLDSRATPWGKAMQRALLALEATVLRVKSAQANFQRTASSTLATLATQIAVLQAVANVQYAEWNSSGGLTIGKSGWTNTPASVRVSSPTGRLEIGYGGSLNSGNGIFAYQVVGDQSGTLISRDTVFGNYAQRVALAGGAQLIGSGFNSVIVDVPKGESLTVSVQMNSITPSTYFFGAKVQARVAP